MGYNLLIDEVYWGYNPFTSHLLISWHIQVYRPTFPHLVNSWIYGFMRQIFQEMELAWGRDSLPNLWITFLHSHCQWVFPQRAIAIGVLTSNRGEGDEPLWRIGRGTRVPLQGAVDVVPLLGAIVVCYGGGRGGWRPTLAEWTWCHCRVPLQCAMVGGVGDD